MSSSREAGGSPAPQPPEIVNEPVVDHRGLLRRHWLPLSLALGGLAATGIAVWGVQSLISRHDHNQEIEKAIYSGPRYPTAPITGETESSSSTAAPSPTDTQVAAGIDYIPPSEVVSATFIPQHGSEKTIAIGPTSLQMAVANRIATPTIDPPLVYCPDVTEEQLAAKGITKKHSIATKRADCEKMYEVLDYGLLRTSNFRVVGDKRLPVAKYPTVIVAHASISGFDLSGNRIAEIKEGDELILRDANGDEVDLVAQEHYEPVKGTNDLQQLIDYESSANLPRVVVATCDPAPNKGNQTNYVMVYRIVAAHRAPQPASR